MFKGGGFLRLVNALKKALQDAEIDNAKYSGHSLRIGAATAAAVNGLEDSIIKTLGRWKSIACLCYVQIPPNQPASYSKMLYMYT